MSASSCCCTGITDNRERSTSMEFFAEHSLYVVLLIALVVWGGIYAYLVRVDGKVKKLEDQLHQ